MTRRADPVPRRVLRARLREPGVTLLELLIVLSIMAIIAGLVIPLVGGGVSSAELKAAAREVAAGLRLARSEAMASRRDTRLVLDMEQRRFQVEGDRRVHALPPKLDLKLYTAQSDLVSDRVGAIRFFPDGGSNGGRITLASGERKFDVDIDWLTGRVAILD